MADKSGLTKQRRALTKLWLNARWPIIGAVAVIVIAVVGVVVYGKLQEAQKTQRGQAAKQAVSTILKRVSSEFSKTRKKISAAIDENALAAIVASGDAGAMVAAETELVDSSDVVIAAKLLPAGYDTLDRSQNPPIGYAVLDLLKKSRAAGEAPPPEMHLFKDEARHIAWIVRLVDGDGTLHGHLRLALKAALVTRSLKGVKIESGFAELRQPLSKGRPLVLAGIGDKSLRAGRPATQVAVPKTAWEVAFWIEGPAPMQDADGGMMPVIGAVAIVIALAGVLVVMKKRKKPVEAQAPAVDTKADIAAKVASNIDGDLDPLDIGPPPPSELESEGSADDLAAQEESAEASSGEVEAGGVSPVIFRAYDIRGIVAENLTPEVVSLIGKALGSEAYDRSQQTIAVGYDGRLTGPKLAEALIEGIRSTGRDVIEIGRVPTPVLYFATHYLNTGSGVIVTGSHNPPEYNGLKIMLGGETLFGESIQGLRERIEAGNFQAGQGSLQTMDVLPEYIRRVTEDVPVALGNAFKVVVDCGNGVAGDVAPKLLRALGHDVIELFCEVDGNFPNHHPDPSKPENLADLISAIKENEADIGFAFDGDGDRLGVVDANGKILWPDLQMMLYARDILSRNPGAQIVYDVKCTNRLGKVIKKLGGEPLMWKTGHSFIKNKMRETGALLAGEMSGHIFFKERWYGFDDAMYAAARMLELLLSLKQPPTEIFAKLPTGVATPELNLTMVEGEHLAFMEKFVEAADFSGGEMSTIDGVRVDYDDGWGLVRASNTTPCLVLRFEADDEAGLERIQTEFRNALLGQDSSLQLPF